MKPNAKKSLLISLLLFLPLGLLAKDDVYAGAGPYVQTQPYSGADAQVLPSPVIFFDNQLFYVRWTRVGLYFLGESGDELSWGFSLTAQPRPFGYEHTDSKTLQGMEHRSTSWEGGLAFGVENKTGFIELLALHDLLDNSNGSLLRAEIGSEYTWGDWYFLPSVLLIWYSDPFNDYYYGVRADEATASRPAYHATAGLNGAVQAYLNYDISEHWHVLGNLRVDYLNPTIRNSPITDDDFMISGMISLLYSFNLFGEDTTVLDLPE
jgi:outer membrane protein